MAVATAEYAETVTACAAYFATLCRKRGPDLLGSGKPDGGLRQQQALHVLHLELENLLEAVDTAVNYRQPGELLAFAEHLWYLLRCAGEYHRLGAIYSRLYGLVQEQPDPLLEAYILLGLSCAKFWTGQYAESAQHCERIIKLGRALKDPRLEAHGLRGKVSASDMRSGEQVDWVQTERALELCRSAGDQVGVIASLRQLSGREYGAGRHAAAEEILREAVALARSRGDELSAAYCLGNIGLTLGSRGRWAEAREFFLEIHGYFLRVNDRQSAALGCYNLAGLLLLEGNTAEAEPLLLEGLALAEAVNDPHTLSLLRIELGRCWALSGRHAQARQILEQELEQGRAAGALWSQFNSLGALAQLDYLQGDHYAICVHLRQVCELESFLDDSNAACLCGLLAAALAWASVWEPAALLQGAAQARFARLGAVPDLDARVLEEVAASLAAVAGSSPARAKELAQLRDSGAVVANPELPDLMRAAIDQYFQTPR